MFRDAIAPRIPEISVVSASLKKVGVNWDDEILMEKITMAQPNHQIRYHIIQFILDILMS